MRAANHTLITAELSACGHSTHLSPHARQRTIERSSIAPSRVLGLISSRRALLLPYRDHNRSYHLLFDKEKADFMIGVVAIDRARTGNDATVVTILSRAQFEKDAGRIASRALRTAASRVLDPIAFRRWEDTEFGPGAAPRTYRVFTYFQMEDGSVGYEIFRNPPLCSHFVDKHSLANAAGHPGFWEWYARRAKRVNLPIESVLSVRIADTDKVRLDLAAPIMECPCCTQ